MMWKPRSAILEYFEKTSNVEVVTCKLCHASVKSCGNTTNIRNHIKRNHPSITQSKDAVVNKVRRISPSVASTSSTEPHEENVDDPDVMADDNDFAEAPQRQGTLNFASTSASTSSGIVDNDSIASFSGSASVRSIQTTSSSNTPQSVNLSLTRQSTISESILNIKSYDKGGYKTQAITDALVYMVAKDNLPLSITEKQGFQFFMQKAVPMYKVPCRKTLTKMVKSKYEVLSTLIKSKLSLVDHLTLTSNIWTDTLNTTSFLSMTVHFLSLNKVTLESVTIGVLELSASLTAENISTWFEYILAQWGIKKSRIFTVVTDNESNILSAVNKTFTPEKHLPCFAHTLNLVSERALANLTDVHNVINKIKSIVTFFKQSVAASDELRKLCDFKLKQSVPTRWNSIYFMIDRFILCSNHIASVLINIRRGPEMLTADEIDIAKEMLLVLKPMEVATRELCGQKYVTGSTVIPLINCLIKKTESIDLTHPTALTLKRAMLDNLNHRFGRMEERSLLSISTILDPRFKTIHLNNPLASSRAIKFIKNQINEIKNNCDEPSSSNQGFSDDDSDSLWSVHNELVTKKKAASQSSEQSEERIPTELKHYLNQPTIPLGDDILKYWDINGNMFPLLKIIVQPFLSVVATSVPSERLFSKAGNIMTEKRNRFKGEKLQQLLFLSSLNFEDWHIE
ncbi:zinc finger BED domain-containing protein 1 isoform X2 [Acyrthosiphon pisum]|uniref:BED-type domain-containing protein n=1 Tax=Acyrthosiphon pisum TaxID=7029 RepID=A0A8R2JSH1_ACYPI|nr:zinc finger BED domain-containing protein 1 isoform X2 [Acyrthosiphon pisum]